MRSPAVVSRSPAVLFEIENPDLHHLSIVTQPNFQQLLDSNTSIYFLPFKFDHWYKMNGGGRNYLLG